MRATSDRIDVWGLLWRAPPLPTGEEIKMVWAANGTGDFQIRAAQNDTAAELVMGPALHAGSNWDRPGEEWGTAFVFPAPGCWEITISRGNDVAHIWVEVAA